MKKYIFFVLIMFFFELNGFSQYRKQNGEREILMHFLLKDTDSLLKSVYDLEKDQKILYTATPVDQFTKLFPFKSMFATQSEKKIGYGNTVEAAKNHLILKCMIHKCESLKELSSEYIYDFSRKEKDFNMDFFLNTIYSGKSFSIRQDLVYLNRGDFSEKYKDLFHHSCKMTDDEYRRFQNATLQNSYKSINLRHLYAIYDTCTLSMVYHLHQVH